MLRGAGGDYTLDVSADGVDLHVSRLARASVRQPLTRKQLLQAAIQRERRLALVVNTRAQRAARQLPAVQSGLTARGFTMAVTHCVGGHTQVRAAVREAVSRGVALVVVGGGDGTLSAAMDAFAYRDVALGILPLGTGNSFARTLGLPLSLTGALDVLVDGKVADVDLGMVGDHYFANVVTLGFPADAAFGISPALKRVLGPLAYGLSALRNLGARRAFWCRLDLDGRPYRLRTHQVVVANGSFFGTRRVPPGADVESRRFVVSVLASSSRWQLARLWARWLLGQSAASAGERVCRARVVRLAADPPQAVSVDGERGPHTPVRLTLAPEALNVLVPRAFPDR